MRLNNLEAFTCTLVERGLKMVSNGPAGCLAAARKAAYGLDEVQESPHMEWSIHY